MLTREDWELWKRITKNDKKLVPENVFEELVILAATPEDAPMPKFKIPVKQKQKYVTSLLREGDFTAMDGANAQRIKRGDYKVDVTLDLHGYTQEEAFNALKKTVKKTVEKNGRLILVITGKGRKNAFHEPTSPGILRQMLPIWVNHGEIRSYLLAFGPAHNSHGGSGAFYLMIKRKRGSA